MTGSGSEGDPFIIYDVTDLQAMENSLAAYYELANDIDASATTGWDGGAGFDPVGKAATPFTGHFDGKGFTISDLFISRPATELIGLFGFTRGAQIQDVGLQDCDIEGNSFTGALAGYFEKDVVPTDSVITGCWSTGNVRGRWETGGLVGEMEGSISESYSECAVITTRGMSAGLIGIMSANGIVSKCYATGDVASIAGQGTQMGGFVGYCACTSISDCYSKGDVVSDSGDETGGFVGQLDAGIISNCYSTGLVTGLGTIGGFIAELVGGAVNNSFWDTQTSGQATSDGGTGKTTAEMKTESTFSDAGWDVATIWTICAGINSDYPCLIDITPSCTIVAATPTVTTDPATAVGQTSATLNGELADDGGEACDCGFEYGETTDYGTETATQSKTTGETFSQEVLGLRPGGILYHFRAIATNSAGRSHGADQTFHTSALSAEAHQALGKGYALGRHGL